jgi:chemotaxis protein histidine kinase CheA
MLGSAGRSEFFAREAADYLRALGPLYGDTPPEGTQFVRLARALRGAAMLAGPASFTRAASQLEHIAKLIHQGALAWEKTAPVLRDSHAEFERLAALAGAWNDEGDHAAFALADRLRSATESTPPPPPPAPGPRATQSIQVFVAREAAAVAAAARDAAGAVAGAVAPPSDRLAPITRAMQSLRGLAGLGELAPLPDLLDATETAVRELQRYPALPPGAAELCSTAAEAFDRVARQVTDGRPDPELAEAHRFADHLLRTLNGADVVLPIDALNAVLARTPAESRWAEPLDLASLGERLRAGADQLRHAPARSAARLQALVLVAVLRDAPGGLGRRPAGRLIARLVDRLLDAAGRGDPAAVALLLDEAGSRLARDARGDLAALEQSLDDLELAPSAEAAADEEMVVDIADLAPTPQRPAIDVPVDRTPLERGLSAYSRMVRDHAPLPAWPTEPPRPEIPVMEPEPEPEPVPIELLAPEEPQAEDIVPVEALAPDQPELDLVPIESLAPTDLVTDVVPIESLLYSGRAALERADEVRRLLQQSLEGPAQDVERVGPLVRELLDLVPLALADRL